MPRTVVTAAAFDGCIRLLTADAPKPGSVSPMLRSSDQTADCRLQIVSRPGLLSAAPTPGRCSFCRVDRRWRSWGALPYLSILRVSFQYLSWEDVELSNLLARFSRSFPNTTSVLSTDTRRSPMRNPFFVIPRHNQSNRC